MGSKQSSSFGSVETPMTTFDVGVARKIKKEEKRAYTLEVHRKNIVNSS